MHRSWYSAVCFRKRAQRAKVAAAVWCLNPPPHSHPMPPPSSHPHPPPPLARARNLLRPRNPRLLNLLLLHLHPLERQRVRNALLPRLPQSRRRGRRWGEAPPPPPPPSLPNTSLTSHQAKKINLKRVSQRKSHLPPNIAKRNLIKTRKRISLTAPVHILRDLLAWVSLCQSLNLRLNCYPPSETALLDLPAPLPSKQTRLIPRVTVIQVQALNIPCQHQKAQPYRRSRRMRRRWQGRSCRGKRRMIPAAAPVSVIVNLWSLTPVVTVRTRMSGPLTLRTPSFTTIHTIHPNPPRTLQTTGNPLLSKMNLKVLQWK